MSKGPMPWIKFEPGAWRSDPLVRAMKCEERGAFITLFVDCYEEGGLPKDPEYLAFACGVSLKKFEAMWSRILHRCFDDHEGRWWNPKMLRDLLANDQYRERQRLIAMGIDPDQSKGAIASALAAREEVKATQSKAKATPRVPSGVPEGSQGVPLGSPKGTHDLPPLEGRRKKEEVNTPQSPQGGRSGNPPPDPGVDGDPDLDPRPSKSRRELDAGIALAENGKAPLRSDLIAAMDGYREMRADQGMPPWTKRTWLKNLRVFNSPAGQIDQPRAIAAFEWSDTKTYQGVFEPGSRQGGKADNRPKPGEMRGVTELLSELNPTQEIPHGFAI